MEVIGASAQVRRVYQCDFCCEIFETLSEKSEHILSHFQQQLCDKCDQNLLRIGEQWYVLHAEITCIEKCIKSEPIDDSDSLDAWKCHDSNNPNLNTDADQIEPLKCDESINDSEDIVANNYENSIDEFSTFMGTNDVASDAEDLNDIQFNSETTDNSLIKIEIKDEIKDEMIDDGNESEVQGESIGISDDESRIDCYSNPNTNTVVSQESYQPHIVEEYPNEEKIFECDECGKRFANNFELYKHHRHRSFCGKCEKRYCFMATHQKTCDSTKFRCSKCKRLYDSKHMLRFHMKVCNLNKSRDAPLLETNITFEMIAKNKMRINLSNDNKDGSNDKAVKKVLLNGIPSARSRCEICKKEFLSKSILQMHIRAYHPKQSMPAPGRFECEKCKDKFATKYELTKHALYARTCTCGRIFCSMNGLIFHQKYCLMCRFACQFCNSTYISKGSLNIHIRRKHNEQTENKSDDAAGGSRNESNTNIDIADTGSLQVFTNSIDPNS